MSLTGSFPLGEAACRALFLWPGGASLWPVPSGEGAGMERIRIYTGGNLHEAEKTQMQRWRRKQGCKFYYIREMRVYVPVSENFKRQFLREEWRLAKREQRRRDFPCPPAELLDWQGEREAGAPDPAELLTRREESLELSRAIKALPLADREFLALWLKGISERTLAARLGCSKTAVHKRKMRIRKALGRGRCMQ